jgi:hypothetical protein
MRHLRLITVLALLAVAGCTSRSGGSAETDAVKQRFSSYSIDRAQSEGFVPDSFCLASTDFGQSAQLGAMGYHATDESRLRGPIEVNRPQAIMFNADGKPIGVEYEVTTDSVSEPPQLFGQTFTKLPPHAGVEHEHYALHFWFIDNPSGQFADFNPLVSCSGTAPAPSGVPAPGHGPGH